MAKDICCICGKKISFLDDHEFLSKECKEPICATCGENKRYLTVPECSEKYRNAGREYFERIFYECGTPEYIRNEVVKFSNIRNERIERKNAEIEAENRKKIAEEQLRERYECLKKYITTGYYFEGYRIVDTLGTFSGEAVMGTGFMSELCASVADLFGSESEAFADKMKRAKEYAKYRLLKEVLSAGGNAIIGIDYDYITLGANMIGVSANGTGVVIEPMYQ